MSGGAVNSAHSLTLASCFAVTRSVLMALFAGDAMKNTYQVTIAIRARLCVCSQPIRSRRTVETKMRPTTN